MFFSKDNDVTVGGLWVFECKIGCAGDTVADFVDDYYGRLTHMLHACTSQPE